MDSELISMMNSIQDLYVKAGYSAFDVPCIAALFAVVGSQSSGKSSVLENIIGRDILPRGSGIVTRRPLIIQAKYDEKDERGEFAHAPGKIFRTPQEIMDEIDAETNRLLGDSVNVSDKPINLKYFSKGTADLTLIDLPGMVRYSVSGQADDVSDKIRNVILKYIGAPNCLILAVSAANSDLANSDALFLARSVDPDGRRTIGVLTKLDIMDKGTDALDVLNNEVVKLHHGWIGVVNRSQKDIKEKTQITQALQSEMEFFQNHESYKTISSRLGTVFLRKSLREKLLDHIKTLLPSMKAKINKENDDLKKTLLQFKESAAIEKQSKVFAMKTMSLIVKAVIENLEGRASKVSLDTMAETAKIKAAMHEKFSEGLNRVTGSKLSDASIRIIMKNVTNLRSNYSPIESAVNVIIRKELRLLLEPCIQCLNTINTEMHTLLKNASKIKEYPMLQEYFLRILEEVLNSKFENCRKKITDSVDMQYNYIAYPDFNPMMEVVKGYQKVNTRLERPKEKINIDSIISIDAQSKSEGKGVVDMELEGTFFLPKAGGLFKSAGLDEIYCKLEGDEIYYTKSKKPEKQYTLYLNDYGFFEDQMEFDGVEYFAIGLEPEKGDAIHLLTDDHEMGARWFAAITGESQETEQVVPEKSARNSTLDSKKTRSGSIYNMDRSTVQKMKKPSKLATFDETVEYNEIPSASGVRQETVIRRTTFLESKPRMTMKSIRRPTMKQIRESVDVTQTEVASLNEEEIIRNSVKIYFNLVKKSIRDNVLKIISYYFINAFKNDIEATIFGKLTVEDEGAVQKMMALDPRLIEERNLTEKRIQTLDLVLLELSRI